MSVEKETKTPNPLPKPIPQIPQKPSREQVKPQPQKPEILSPIKLNTNNPSPVLGSSGPVSPRQVEEPTSQQESVCTLQSSSIFTHKTLTFSLEVKIWLGSNKKRCLEKEWG
jgi:hypothetical protein